MEATTGKEEVVISGDAVEEENMEEEEDGDEEEAGAELDLEAIIRPEVEETEEDRLYAEQNAIKLAKIRSIKEKTATVGT